MTTPASGTESSPAPVATPGDPAPLSSGPVAPAPVVIVVARRTGCLAAAGACVYPSCHCDFPPIHGTPPRAAQ